MHNQWRRKTIGESVRITKGITYASSDYASDNDGDIFLTIKCFVKGGGFNPEGIKYFRGLHLPEQEIGAGELLIAKTDLTRDGDIIGSPMLAPDFGDGWKVLPSMDVSVLRQIGNEVDIRFLFYRLMLGDARRFMWAHSAGSTVLHLESKALPKFTFMAPESEDQGRIAEVLQTVDRNIKQTEDLIEKYQHIKAGLMHDAFERGMDSSGHLRPSNDSRTTKFGLIPKHWSIGSLLDIADRVRQPILTGPFGADLGTDDFIAEGVPVLRIGNVQQGELDLTDLQFVSEAKARMLERYKIKEGDLLFARQGATTGRNALANADVEGYLINYHVIRVALDQSRCAPLFIEAAFAGEIVKRQIERDKGRGTREGINTAQLKALELPLTSVEEQGAIARILTTHTTQIEDTQKELAKLRNLKLGLMKDLLTGRVPVPAKD